MRRLCVSALCLLAASVPAVAKPKPPAKCNAYALVIERDAVTVNLEMVGLNKPQWNWYRKHGDRGKYAGICSAINSQMSAAILTSRALRKTGINPSLPIYLIVWGEHVLKQPYSHTYSTQEPVYGTEPTGIEKPEVPANQVGTVSVPRETAGVRRSYVADGVLEIWKPAGKKGKGVMVPIQPLHGYRRWFHSASASLLKNGMEAIAKAEMAKGQGRDRPPHP